MAKSSRFLASVLLALTTLAAASPAGAAVVVRHFNCDPVGRSEICADASVVPITAFLNGTAGTMFAGGAATATHLRAYVDNGFGGSARVTSTHSDLYTLVGPGRTPITLTANLAVHGTIASGQNPSWSVGGGFMNSGASYFAAPASFFATPVPGAAVIGPYARQLAHQLTMVPGEPILLAFEIDLLAGGDSKLDFHSTVTLGFPDLPDGYYIQSVTGFDGVGSRPVTGGTVPEPDTLLLSLLACAAASWAGRSARRAGRGSDSCGM